MLGQSSINFSIVGCGRMGSKYYGMFERGLIKSAHLGAVCDLDMAKMENFENVFIRPIILRICLNQNNQKQSLFPLIVAYTLNKPAAQLNPGKTL